MQDTNKITAIDAALLDALVGADTETDALTLARETKCRPSRAYVTLAILERSGWVRSRWSELDDTTGHRRRLYRLTGAGRVGAAELISTRPQPAARRLSAMPRPVTAFLRLLPAFMGGAR